METISGKLQLFGSFYYKLFYEKMVQSEITFSGLKPGAVTANIGCGPFPITAVQLASYGYNVDCYDISAAARKAVSYLEKTNAGERIRIYNSALNESLYDRYDAFFVSLHIIGKGLLLKNILDNLGTGKIVVYRNPAGWLKRYYETYYPEKDCFTRSVRIRQPLLKESVILKR